MSESANRRGTHPRQTKEAVQGHHESCDQQVQVKASAFLQLPMLGVQD